MAEPDTTRNDGSVDAFIAGVADEPPAMWGSAIVGFGASVNDKGTVWMRLGFSPRVKQTSIYILCKPVGWDAQLEWLGWAASRAAMPDADD